MFFTSIHSLLKKDEVYDRFSIIVFTVTFSFIYVLTKAMLQIVAVWKDKGSNNLSNFCDSLKWCQKDKVIRSKIRKVDKGIHYQKKWIQLNDDVSKKYNYRYKKTKY